MAMAKVGDSKRVQADGDGESISNHLTETEANESGTELVLHNPLVLDVMFNHLPSKYWKSARLVNKAWHSALQSKWRDGMNYKLGLGMEKPVVKTVTTKFLQQQHPFNNRNDPMELGDHPIRNVSIRKDSDCILLQPGSTRFWELFGHGLKSIHLNGIRIEESAHLKRLLFELTPNLEEFSYIKCVCEDLDQKLNTYQKYNPPAALQKNLKVLKLNTIPWVGEQCRMDINAYKPRFPISWIQFFSAFPNIQKVNLEMDPLCTNRPSDLLKLLEAIDIIRKANNNKVLNITELHVSGEAGFSHIDVKKKKSVFPSLPISTLDVDVTNMYNDDIIPLVQTFKSTLRQLTLGFSDLDNEIEEPFPKDMFTEGLTKLCLNGPFISSLEFLLYLPNLEELKVHNIPCILPPNVNIAAVAPLVNLKKLTFTMNSDSVPSKQMDILAKLMPNVKDIECYVDANAFEALCRGWANLEHLHVCARFYSHNEDFFLENLTKLKCLRSLKINGDIEVTDKSVFEGFLKMSSLTKVCFNFDVKITEDGLQALEHKLTDEFAQQLRKQRRYIPLILH